MLVDKLSLYKKFVVNYLLTIKEQTFVNCKWDLSAFSLAEVDCFPLHALTSYFQAILKTPHFITGTDPVKQLCIIQKMRHFWWNKCFCSAVKIQGTIFEQIFLIPKSSIRISCTVSRIIFSAVINHTHLFFCVFGCLLLISWCTSCSFLNCVYCLKSTQLVSWHVCRKPFLIVLTLH